MSRKRKASQRSSNANLRFARACFQHVEPLRVYVDKINASLAADDVKVNIEKEEDVNNEAYLNIIDNLLIAGQCSPLVPSSAVEGLRGTALIRPCDIIERVICSALRPSGNSWEAQNNNVLVAGFSLRRPSGHGSLFRSLDVRAPSAAIQVLLSPPWQQLFARLGHVVMYYLLSSTTLLLSISSSEKRLRLERSQVKDVTSPRPLTMLQLCGPIIQSHTLSKHNEASRKHIIVYKQHILYRTTRTQFRKSEKHKDDPRPVEHTAKSAFRESLLPPEQRSLALLNDGLPYSNCLQRLRPGSSKSAVTLYRNIFTNAQARPEDSGEICAERAVPGRNTTGRPALRGGGILKRPRRNATFIPKRQRPTLELLEQMIERVGKRSFRSVLGERCKLHDMFRAKGAVARRIPMRILTHSSTKPRRVAQFLVACVRQAIPVAMFGSSENLLRVEHGIHTLVRRRTRNETFDLRSFFACTGFKVKDVPWLWRLGPDGRRVTNPTDLRFRQEKFSQFLTWLFHGFVVPLLLKNFYVTESEMYRQQVLFYRKEVWNIFTDIAMRGLLHRDRRLFVAIPSSSAATAMRRKVEALERLGLGYVSGSSMAFSRLRFTPKKNGARPIQRLHAKLWTNITSAAKACTKPFPWLGEAEIQRRLDSSVKTFKSFFLVAQRIFAACCNYSPGIVGASVFGLDDIYEKVHKFKTKWVKKGRNPVYAVALDITKSFDTIPLRTLTETILPKVVRRERYVLLRYAVVTRCDVSGRASRRFESYVCEAPGEETYFPKLIKDRLWRRHQRAVYIDLVRTQVVHREDFLNLLEEFLLNNIVLMPRRNRAQAGASYTKQIRGVAQGNPLSPLLTSLFYAHIEQSDLNEFTNDSSTCSGTEPTIFMRQVDDTFFATTERDVTRRFMVRMARGWDDIHGFSVNETKTRCNFEASEYGQSNVQVIPWCGLLLDTKTVEVRNDFTRYSTSCLRDSLSVDFESSCGRSLAKKAWTCFRPKVHPILLDPSINTRRTVALNIYQAAFLVALKICAYAITIQVQNASFFRQVVQTAVARVSVLIQRTTSSAIAKHMECKQALAACQVKYLALAAFKCAITQNLAHYQCGRAIAAYTASTLQDSLAKSQADVLSCFPTSMQMLQEVTTSDANRSLWAIRL